MKHDLKHYRSTPVGEQLCEHLKKRTQLRQEAPVLSFSFKNLAKKFEFPTHEKNRDDMPHAAA